MIVCCLLSRKKFVVRKGLNPFDCGERVFDDFEIVLPKMKNILRRIIEVFSLSFDLLFGLDIVNEELS